MISPAGGDGGNPAMTPTNAHPLRSTTFGAVALLFCLMGAASAVNPPEVVISDENPTSLTQPQIEANVEGGAALVYLDWWEEDDPNNVVRVFLDGSGSSWYGTLPLNHSGHAWFKAYAEDENGVPSAPTLQDYEITEDTTNPKGLTEQRYPNIFNWGVNQNKGLINTSDWYGEELSEESSVPQMICLLGTKTTAVPPAQKGKGTVVAGGFVRTANAVSNGVGSIWFKARMASTNEPGGTLSIERISYTLSGTRKNFGDPQEITEVRIPKAQEYNQWYQFHLILQEVTTNNVVFRIRNKTLASDDADRVNKTVDLCDIVLTPIIPDVRIVKDEMDYDPGYPSIQDPVTFHVTVSNLYAAAPAEHITPRLVWRQGERSAWQEKVMEHAADDGGRRNQAPGTFFCTLDEADGLVDGPFEYFYTVSFSGYTPRFAAIKDHDGRLLNNIRNFEYDGSSAYKHLIGTDTWALLTDAAGTVSEGRAPAYYPDFSTLLAERGAGEFDAYAWSRDVVTDSPAYRTTSGSWWSFTRAFDLRKLDEGWPIARKAYYSQRSIDGSSTSFQNRPIEIEGEYPYNVLMAADGVRRFRSLYTGLAAKTEDWGTNVQSRLQPAYEMQHVGDYTWQAIIHITNAVDSLFSVTGGLYAAEGGTNFVAGPFEWLQIDQPETAINPPMSGDLSFDPVTGDPIHNELQRFTTHSEIETKSIPTEVEFTVTNLASGAGWFVGIVTNVQWSGKPRESWPVDATTGETIEPGVGDVAFWYGVLAEEPGMVEDPDTHEMVEGVVTNIVSDILWNEVVGTNVTWNLDMTAETNEVRRLVERSEFDAYYDWGLRVAVTNVFASAIVTNATFATDTRTEWSVVTNVVWIPDFDEETIDREHRTRVQIDYDGFLMFRFCTTNGSYQIRRAAWQDFNEWQAAETNFSLSFGLYGVKEYLSDLNGRDTTVFADSYHENLDSLAPTSDWSDAANGEYWSGLIGKNAKVFEERMRTETDEDVPTSQRRNKAFLLNTHPSDEGSVQTTSIRAENGRDTLRMRVRSSTDDARSIVWNNEAAGSSQNYRVLARMADNQTDDRVSDGEHSLSLIGYWQSPYDYWEARIVQKTYLAGTATKPLRTWFEVHLYKWADGECEELNGTISHSGRWGDGNYQASSYPPTFPGWRNSGAEGRKSNYWDNPAKDGTFLRSNDGGWTFALEMKTSGTSVTPILYAYYTTDLVNGTTNKFFRYTGPATPGGTLFGKPGYNMRDCGLEVVPYVQGLNEKVGFGATGVAAFSGIPNSGKNDWYRSDTAIYDPGQKIDVWTVGRTTVSGTSVASVTRPAPIVYFGVEVFRTGREVETNLFTAPVNQQVAGMPSKWDDHWDDYHRILGQAKDGIQSVQSWKWEEKKFPMNFWDEAFLNIRAHSANGNDKSKGLLAVDTLSCAEWRGKTIWDPKNTEPDARAKARSEIGSGWTATYAAIAADGRTGRKYELNRSRANPNKIQAIVSPLLENGVGDITFRCQARNHPVKVSVEVGDTSGFWTTVPTCPPVEVSPTDAPVPLYFLFATNISGRVRIRTLDPDGMAPGELGTLFVDDIRATDYPAQGESSWEVYNALVSSFPTNYTVPRGWDRTPKFDGVSSAAADMRSAVLNDGVDKETLSGYPLVEHAPYLQTPSIETGVGEISFWYRASPDNGDPPSPAKIRLLVAESSRIADADWHELTVDDLYYDDKNYDAKEDDPNWVRQKNALNALSTITNNVTWNYFSVEFYDEKDRVLRVVGDTNGAPNRVMLDNVLITEPVRSSIDVGTIEFDPDIPLNTKSTGAKVRLVNPRMNPHDIHVYLDWYVPDLDLVPFVIRTENVVMEPRTETIHTNVVFNGQVFDATFPYTTYDAVTNRSVDETLIPTALRDSTGDNWGYESWKGVANGSRKGTLTFTNAPGDAYTFYSENRIPTDEWPADTVFQYCVRVDYDGQFKQPVFSETQGRVKNGFWFDNPPWYEPIDLNVAFGTKETPVAHAFVFSCTTNVVFINEFRPWLGKGNHQDEQFVELIGPEKAKIGNWRLEHWWATSGGAIDKTWINFTNILASTAAFTNANNAHTNKGWGFYVLGCSAIDYQQRLFSEEDEQNETAKIGNHPFLNTVGAMRLRRPMGAYVDAITWGTTTQTKPMTKMGFGYAGNMLSPTSDSKIGWVYYLDVSGDWLDWRNNTRSMASIGGYNGGEEDILPWLDGSVDETPVAFIAQPRITEFRFDSGTTATLKFEVCSTNGVALDAKSGYEWTVQAQTTLGGAWTTVDTLTGVEAPETGVWVEYEISVPAAQDALFYRIKATREE